MRVSLGIRVRVPVTIRFGGLLLLRSLLVGKESARALGGSCEGRVLCPEVLPGEGLFALEFFVLAVFVVERVLAVLAGVPARYAHRLSPHVSTALTFNFARVLVWHEVFGLRLGGVAAG